MATKTQQNDQQKTVRLQKVLAGAGYGSRRSCEEFILAGRVTVDGETVNELGVQVDPAGQKILLDGEPVVVERKRYFMVNKPAGYLCTHSDPEGRRRVIDLFPGDRERLFTVGRLDEHTTGLLLVTNDGELANRLAHPRYKVPRVYEAQVVGVPSQETVRKMQTGIRFVGGRLRVHQARRLRTRGKSALLELVMLEGRNREIRRLLASVGHKVIHLRRVGFGPLRLAKLPIGQTRPLKSVEIKQLKMLLEIPPGSAKPRSRKKPPAQKSPAKKTSTRKPPARKPKARKTPAKKTHTRRPR